MTVIAGILSPWDTERTNRLLDQTKMKTPDNMNPLLDNIGRYLKSVSNGLGDGLVSLDSSSLKGVPCLTVEGTHLSMIRNVRAESDRLPPAVPLVIQRLREAFPP
jgi:hypothetical protein